MVSYHFRGTSWTANQLIIYDRRCGSGALDYDDVMVHLFYGAVHPHIFILAQHECHICYPHIYPYAIVVATYGQQKYYGRKEYSEINTIGGCELRDSFHEPELLKQNTYEKLDHSLKLRSDVLFYSTSNSSGIWPICD